MKWVRVREGKYKYVDNTDPRPAVHLPRKKMGPPFIPFNPSWKRYEKNIWHEDNKTSREAVDRFDDERAHEVRTDPRAARWEKSRKEEWAKNKPLWVKKYSK